LRTFYVKSDSWNLIFLRNIVEHVRSQVQQSRRYQAMCLLPPILPSIQPSVFNPSVYLTIHSAIRRCIQKFPDWPPERALQMVQLSPTRCSYIAILWVSLVSFAIIILCIASHPETFGYLLYVRSTLLHTYLEDHTPLNVKLITNYR
jgi:hypothetical protein